MSHGLQQFTEWTGAIAATLWGFPSVIFLVGTGLYLTFRLKFIQFRGFLPAIKILTAKNSKMELSDGETTPFQALCTSLSATVGTGNITGIATAIALGGPGAIFWMWITALVGMAIRFTSVTLAVQYRHIKCNGEISGGPMYTIKHGLNMPKLAFLYALFTLIASLGIGNTVQSNAIVNGLTYAFPDIAQHDLTIGFILATLVGLVIIGGVKRVAQVAEFIVPFMAIIYFSAALCVLFVHIERIPNAFATIFILALNPNAAGAAAFATAIQYGMARGLFSNEAGLGSAAIAHATAKTNHPAKQGLVAMLGPSIDTLFICTLTGLVIVVTGSSNQGLNGSALSIYAFNLGSTQIGMGNWGTWVVSIGLVFFAFTSMISWSYYGDRCAEFIFGRQSILPYRIIFCVFIIIGAHFPLRLVWNLADIANIFMAVPNLISVILLSRRRGTVTKRLLTNAKSIAHSTKIRVIDMHYLPCSSPHKYLCNCICKRTGNLSAKIQSANALAANCSWLGENKTSCPLSDNACIFSLAQS